MLVPAYQCCCTALADEAVRDLSVRLLPLAEGAACVRTEDAVCALGVVACGGKCLLQALHVVAGERLFVARPGSLDAAAVAADAVGKQADGEGVAG